jgi:RND family efflux transporter MFP subunit
MRPAVLFLAFTPGLVAAPPEVAVCRPVEREVTDFADFTGRTEPSTSVDVRSRVTGMLDKVLFKEGSEVKKGDVLFQLDDRAQRAELAKAQAEVVRAEARLKQAEADQQRLVRLVEAKAVARDELEKAVAGLDEAKASILLARATFELTKLSLESTRIVAPISGRIGRSRLDAGNVVRGDADKDGALATIIVADPLYVAFDVDERTLLRLVRRTRERKAADALVPVGVGLTDEEGYPRTATVSFVDRRVEPDTGTVRMRAVLANGKGEIWPGQFARVRLPIGDPRKALLIPDSAIRRTGEAASAFIVTDKNLVVERAIRPGTLVGSLRVIEEGLKADDWVVLDARARKVGEEVKPRRESAPPETAKPEVPHLGTAAPRSLPEFPAAGPAVVVNANYAGANSFVVEQIVAGPIEAQLNGLDGVVHRVLACTDDGEMRLTLVLKRGTDLNKAIVQAQKRIALAEPTLPDEVRRTGVKLKKHPVHLLAVAILSPDDSRDRKFLAAYAEKQVRDELGKVSDVADVAFYGDAEPTAQARVSIDPDHLRARGLTASEVANAVRDQNLSANLLSGRRPTINVAGPFREPEKLEEIVIKATADGRVIRLRDVARVEIVTGWGAATALDGKPCAILLVARAADADARATAKVVRARLADIAKTFPEGIAYKVIDDDP